MVLAAVKSHGWALQYASEELRNDKDVILTAVYNRSYAISFLPIK